MFIVFCLFSIVYIVLSIVHGKFFLNIHHKDILSTFYFDNFAES